MLPIIDLINHAKRGSMRLNCEVAFDGAGGVVSPHHLLPAVACEQLQLHSYHSQRLLVVIPCRSSGPRGRSEQARSSVYVTRICPSQISSALVEYRTRPCREPALIHVSLCESFNTIGVWVRVMRSFVHFIGSLRSLLHRGDMQIQNRSRARSIRGSKIRGQFEVNYCRDVCSQICRAASNMSMCSRGSVGRHIQ